MLDKIGRTEIYDGKHICTSRFGIDCNICPPFRRPNRFAEIVFMHVFCGVRLMIQETTKETERTDCADKDRQRKTYKEI